LLVKCPLETSTWLFFFHRPPAHGRFVADTRSRLVDDLYRGYDGERDYGTMYLYMTCVPINKCTHILYIHM
jgi:hypothetical protein